MKLVILIPALNEQATIGEVLDGIPSEIPEIDELEKIVIDDGSTDRTAELAREKGASVISHPENRGVGAAFNTGIHQAITAGADVIVNMDGDGQFDPSTIPELIMPIVEDRADFVTCTRFKKPELVPKMPAVKRWGNAWMSRIISTVTGKKFTDVSCGFRAYTRDTVLRLNLFGDFTYTQESFLDLARKNVRMTEVPLPVRGEREFGQSRVASSISRYALRAGSIILLALRDTRPLMFFGLIGLAITALGAGSGGALFIRWLIIGKTSPFQSVVTLSAVLLIIGGLLIVLALVADMLGRIRKNQDHLLYLQKKQIYDRKPDDRSASS
ncbi:MAG: glycosyltransferase family 2 protein [bacterium]